MLEKILRWGVYATALVPLVIFKEFLSPFHFGKVVVFRTLIEILAVLYLTLILKNRSFLPQRTKLFWAITIFVALYGLTSLTGINIYQSVMGTLERMGGWFTLLHFWLFFIIMTSVLRSEKDWMTLVKISIIASVLSTFYGFLQKGDFDWVVGSGGRTRIFGTLGNTALFAGYTIINAYLALFMAFRSKDLARYLYFSAFALNAVAIFSTAVRGSLLAMVVSLALFAVLYAFRGSSRKTKTVFALLVTAIIVGELLLIASRNSDFVKNSGYLRRISDVSSESRTIKTRFWAWQAGLDGWDDSFKTIMLGWGPENFNVPFSLHFNPRFYNGPGAETLFDRAHNMFVEVLVTMGLVGFASYLLMFAVLFWMFWRGGGTNGIILASGLVAYLIHNAFIFDTSANLVAFFIFAGLSTHLFSASTSIQKNTRQKMLPETFRYSAVLLAAVISIFLIYRMNIKPALANYASTRGITASWRNDHKTAVEKFKQAMAYNTFPVYEIRHRFAQYVMESYGKFKKEDGLDPGEMLLLVASESEKNINNLDYLPYLYLSRAYIILGKSDPASSFNDLALQNSLKALEISPTFVRTYYEVAQAYLNKKDYANAIENLQKAVDLNPEVPLSWWYLGVAQVDAGNPDGVATIEEAVSIGYHPSEGDYLRLVNIYAKFEDYEKIAGFYEKLISEFDPDNPQYHASLAQTYVFLGRIDDAMREARRAAQIDPSFEPEARKFAQDLGRQW